MLYIISLDFIHLRAGSLYPFLQTSPCFLHHASPGTYFSSCFYELDLFFKIPHINDLLFCYSVAKLDLTLCDPMDCNM